MKTFIYAIIFSLINCSISLSQDDSDKRQQLAPRSRVTVRVLDKETFKPVQAKILIVSQRPENQIDPVFEDRIYKYRISGNDTTTFSIFAQGYETLNESVRASEINGTEVFYLTRKRPDGNQLAGTVESSTMPYVSVPTLPEDITSVLYFSQSSTDMSARSRYELERLLDFLTKHKVRQIEVMGHTDNVGDPAKNVALSSDRATLVRQLLANSSSPAKVKTKAFGSAKPAAPNDCERNRRFNRRVEIRMEPAFN